jgi:threonine/homoserine/homoserine lactone efflux protein
MNSRSASRLSTINIYLANERAKNLPSNPSLKFMWLYLIQGIGFGFAAAAQPGPLQTFLTTQALTKGWRSTLLSAFAPLVSDGFIVPVVLFVLSQMPAWIQRFLYLAGGLFVLYLAYGAFMAWRNFNETLPATAMPSHQSLLKAALTNVLSPAPYIYWSLVTGPILLAGWHKSSSFGIAFLLGFYVTFVLSLMAIIIVFGAAQKLEPKVNRALVGASAVALSCFGLYQLWLGMMM